MSSVDNQNKPIKPNMQQTQRPVRPNMQLGEKSNRPSMNIDTKPVRPQIKEQATIIKEETTQPKVEIEKEINTKKENKHKVKKEKPVKEKEKKVKEKPIKEKKEKKPVNKKVTLVIVVVVVCVIIGALALTVPKALKSSQQHITLAEKPPVIEEVESTSSEDAQQNQVATTKKEEEPVEQTPLDTVLKVNDKVIIPVTVNTKLETDEMYTDHYSQIEFKVTDTIIGYDKASKVIDEYNETSTNILKIQDKEEFYKANENSELVIFNLEMTIPSDFPTQDTKNGKIYTTVNSNLSIFGKEEENQIITDRYIYNLPSISNISENISELKIGETYKLRYVAVMPTEITNNEYGLKFDCTVDDNTSTYELEGISIESTEIKETLEENTTEETEQQTESIEITE